MSALTPAARGYLPIPYPTELHMFTKEDLALLLGTGASRQARYAARTCLPAAPRNG